MTESKTPPSGASPLARLPRAPRATREAEGRFPLEWKVLTSVGSAVVVLFVSWIAQNSLWAAEQSRVWGAHTRDVLSAVVGLRATLLESEGAARGYLLTGDTSYADTLARLQGPADAQLEALSHLVADNDQQAKRQAELAELVRDRLDLLDHVVDLTQASRRADAIEIVTRAQGSGAMGRIETLLREMRSTEEGILAMRRAAYARDVRDAEIELWGGSGLSFLLAAVVNLYVWRDVRERARTMALISKQAKELAAANRARDDVQAIVSHDLRNPLNTVSMSASLLRSNLQGDREAMQRDVPLIERIERAVTRMNRLIQDLLDASRIDAGKLPVAARAEPASALVDEAVQAAEALAEAKACEVVRGEVDGTVVVQADRHRVLQLFSNLIGNALKFTPEGGTITVTVTRRNSHAEFSVADTGKGIDPAFLPQLFERYKKEVQASRDGAGLGLFIARGIVDAHGGSIAVESVVGEGTTVRFTLPLAERA